MGAEDVAAALAAVTEGLPGGGEDRPGQVEMAEAVAHAIASGRHLVVQAGTGTGKSYAYLVPAATSGETTVVVTATKALQDQLAGKDLPFVAEHLRPQLGHDLSFAVLKGRSNYLCRQRADEATADAAQGALDGLAAGHRDEVAALVAWADTTEVGDRAELEVEPSERAWATVSVTPRECPGAARCPRGEDCFAERARAAAAEADVVVVNAHLYGLHLATDGAVLPPHEVVVFDEAHVLEEIVSATAGRQLGAGRVHAAARTASGVLADETHAARLRQAADQLAGALGPEAGRRLKSRVPEVLTAALLVVRDRADQAGQATRRALDSGPKPDVEAKLVRAGGVLLSLVEDVDAFLDPPEGDVRWVEDGTEPQLRLAPIEVGELLAAQLWDERVAVLTSATVPAVLPERLALPPDRHDVLDVGSPFDYEHQALLYCSAHLPDPRQPGFDEQVHAELEALVGAAGGRTLALFTSHRAMRLAVEALEGKLPGPLLAQGQKPKPALLEAFSADPATSLFATQSFWQGVDVPGDSLALVAIDRLPFARPDDPLFQARREAARADAFRLVDLPRATTLLAQGAGRLVRSSRDRGVVAVFDPRLAKAGYRWDVVRALPPMRRTKDRAEVEAFLRSIHDDA